MSETPSVHSEKKIPLTSSDLRETVDDRILNEAKTLVPKIQVFFNSSDNAILQGFFANHSSEAYSDYRMWNSDFCRDVLKKINLTESQQSLYITAPQLALNEKVGGFTKDKKLPNSIDGKLGKFTLGQLLKALQPRAPLIARAQADIPSAPQETLQDSEKFSRRDIASFGDSYLWGITTAQKLDTSNAVQGRSFLFPKKDSIYEAAKKSLKNNPSYKLLILNGGLNDVYKLHYSEAEFEAMKRAYAELIQMAHEKRIKVAVYTINTIPKTLNNRDDVEKRVVTLNQWLKNDSGADRVFDTSALIENHFNPQGKEEKTAYYDKGKIHPISYAPLAKAVESMIAD